MGVGGAYRSYSKIEDLTKVLRILSYRFQRNCCQSAMYCRASRNLKPPVVITSGPVVHGYGPIGHNIAHDMVHFVDWWTPTTASINTIRKTQRTNYDPTWERVKSNRYTQICYNKTRELAPWTNQKLVQPVYQVVPSKRNAFSPHRSHELTPYGPHI